MVILFFFLVNKTPTVLLRCCEWVSAAILLAFELVNRAFISVPLPLPTDRPLVDCHDVVEGVLKRRVCHS